MQGQSPAAANPNQTPTETMHSNNSSGHAGRDGRTSARGHGKGRMPWFRSTMHYIKTKGPSWVAYYKPRPIDCALSSQPSQQFPRQTLEVLNYNHVYLAPCLVAKGRLDGIVSSHRSRKLLKNTATYKVKVDCEYVGGRSSYHIGFNHIGFFTT